MKKRDLSAIQPIYPLEEWNITETSLHPEHNKRNESIFALGNGFIGMRGTFEEGFQHSTGKSVDGTYLNGFYETEHIRYPENAYGFAENGQIMLNVTNSKCITLKLNDEVFNLATGTLISYKRTLNMKEGTLERVLEWRSPKGLEIRVNSTRLVSFRHKHLAAIRYEVTPLNFSGTLEFTSSLDGNVSNISAGNDPRVGSNLDGKPLQVVSVEQQTGFGALHQRTQKSKLGLVCAMQNSIVGAEVSGLHGTAEAERVHITLKVNATQNTPVALEKTIVYVTTQDFADAELLQIANQMVNSASKRGFEAILSEQKTYMANYWQNVDVTVTGDTALQQGIRFNMLHLLQGAGKDGKTNIAAKGLTGEGYGGHYFWDTEMYVVPFFVNTFPEVSKKLLQYRYSILDGARARARQMAHPRGALFPWRTINGEECSAYFPAGTAQFHINADIAFAIQRYVQLTGDEEFLVQYGAEIVLETARVWADLGFFNPHKNNQFCINGVTGPDEYTAIVNNNLFTNMMAQDNLSYAYYTAQWLQSKHPKDYERIAKTIGLQADEVDEWKRAAENMFIGYDETTGLFMQDDSFLDKPIWDFENTPDSHYPLLLHYHPLVIYRHQVCKQADLVLALFLKGDAFTLDEKRRNYEYYEKVTTHDSSLSACIFSIVASDIGDANKAYKYFADTARLDLDDTHGNVGDGVHIANMAGTWMGIVYGFAGMRTYSGQLSFKPSLPQQWTGYRFHVTYLGRSLEVEVSATHTRYTVLNGEVLKITHNETQLELTPNQSVEIAN
jgi:trehalose/maltose hydrolase-like predicted phosphorylase